MSIKSMAIKLGRKVVAKAPLLCAIGAGVSIITTAVFASKAAIKSKNIIPDAKKELAASRATIGHNFIDSDGVVKLYTKKEFNHDRVVIYATCIKKLAWNFLPAFISGVTGIACVGGCYGIASKRLATTTAALNAALLKNKKYRNIVRREVGDEKEAELWNEAEKETTETLEKTSKTKKPFKKAETLTFTFGPDCREYMRNSVYNTGFLGDMENILESELDQNLYMPLLRGIDTLGIPLSQEERKALYPLGWSRKLNPDSHVRFGDYMHNIDMVYDQMSDTDQKQYKITFNIDGDITDYC